MIKTQKGKHKNEKTKLFEGDKTIENNLKYENYLIKSKRFIDLLTNSQFTVLLLFECYLNYFCCVKRTRLCANILCIDL